MLLVGVRLYKNRIGLFNLLDGVGRLRIFTLAFIDMQMANGLFAVIKDMLKDRLSKVNWSVIGEGLDVEEGYLWAWLLLEFMIQTRRAKTRKRRRSNMFIKL